jgi:hypothetical protein
MAADYLLQKMGAAKPAARANAMYQNLLQRTGAVKKSVAM